MNPIFTPVWATPALLLALTACASGPPLPPTVGMEAPTAAKTKPRDDSKSAPASTPAATDSTIREKQPAADESATAATIDSAAAATARAATATATVGTKELKRQPAALSVLRLKSVPVSFTKPSMVWNPKALPDSTVDSHGFERDPDPLFEANGHGVLPFCAIAVDPKPQTHNIIMFSLKWRMAAPFSVDSMFTREDGAFN